MTRFDITHDEDRLTVTKVPAANRMVVGFFLLFSTLAFLTPIGILGGMKVGTQADARSAGGLLDFTDPHANHFGFLWLVGVALVAILLPIYAVFIYRMRLVYSFDRV